MSQNHLVKMRCSETGEMRWTKKNKKNKKGIDRKLELKKYSPKLKKMVVFKEAKK